MVVADVLVELVVQLIYHQIRWRLKYGLLLSLESGMQWDLSVRSGWWVVGRLDMFGRWGTVSCLSVVFRLDVFILYIVVGWWAIVGCRLAGWFLIGGEVGEFRWHDTFLLANYFLIIHLLCIILWRLLVIRRSYITFRRLYPLEQPQIRILL